MHRDAPRQLVRWALNCFPVSCNAAALSPWLTVTVVCVMSCISEVTTLHVLAAFVQVGTPERSFLELFAKACNLRVAALVERVGQWLLDRPRECMATPPTKLHKLVEHAKVSADNAFPITGGLVLLQMLLEEKCEAAIVSSRLLECSRVLQVKCD